jgi:hypothetical protein
MEWVPLAVGLVVWFILAAVPVACAIVGARSDRAFQERKEVKSLKL